MIGKERITPEAGDIIVAEWPGQGPRVFRIGMIRADVDGVMCAVFGEGSTVGAEALTDLELVDSHLGLGSFWKVTSSPAVHDQPCDEFISEETTHLVLATMGSTLCYNARYE